jgi:methylated-DNA-[protein]-cysteine S-methyltransferase
MKRKVLKATPFGSVGIIWTSLDDNPRIVRVLILKPGLSAEYQASQAYPHAQPSSCAAIDAVGAAIKGILEGEDIEIPLHVADLDSCSSFQQSVLRAEYQIPRGRVSTYGLIATHVGQPKGARAVGNALANNPFPLIVPCHRAVRWDGHLGGFQGGLEMKRALLEKEGIRVDASDRVVRSEFYYERIRSKKGHPADGLTLRAGVWRPI